MRRQAMSSMLLCCSTISATTTPSSPTLQPFHSSNPHPLNPSIRQPFHCQTKYYITSNTTVNTTVATIIMGWRVEGLKGCRVAGLKGWRVEGLKGWRVEGLHAVCWRSRNLQSKQATILGFAPSTCCQCVQFVATILGFVLSLRLACHSNAGSLLLQLVYYHYDYCYYY